MKSRERRGSINIMGDMLAMTTEGIRRTNLMRKANLSFSQLNYYLGILEQRGLVETFPQDRSRFVQITEKGRECLDAYQNILKFIEEIPVATTSLYLPTPRSPAS